VLVYMGQWNLSHDQYNLLAMSACLAVKAKGPVLIYRIATGRTS